jgi:hypothetical protein
MPGEQIPMDNLGVETKRILVHLQRFVLKENEHKNESTRILMQKVAEDVGRIVEIAASHYTHVSAAVSQDAKVYMWG